VNKEAQLNAACSLSEPMERHQAYAVKISLTFGAALLVHYCLQPLHGIS